MTNTPRHKLLPVDVDNIYCATDSAYWSFLTATKEVYVNGDNMVTEFEVEDLEDGKTYTVNADSLASAVDAILAGKHVNSRLREQCARDVADWKAVPKYGVPFDSELSDCIIQIAALGEVVYG